jgi:hypothetical protein
MSEMKLMPMKPYPICCSGDDCERDAEFKMAARWSDGLTEELKTYGMSCGPCLSSLYRQAEIRRSRCRLAMNETIDAIGIYRLSRGRRDVKLERMIQVEQQINQTEQDV